MLFNSYEFIFLFLPLVVFAYYFLDNSRLSDYGPVCLVAASLIFYGYWNPLYVLLIIASIGVNFFISHKADNDEGIKRFSWMVMGVVINLSILGYFKYMNFFIDNLNSAGVTEWTIDKIILPLGISFFTFQQIAYLVDVYKGYARPGRLINYALFVTFFPQLIAGPIVHHSEMMPQFATKRIGKKKLENLSVGISIFSIGLFKKVVIADSVSQFATPVFQSAEIGAQLTFADAWLGALAYTFQLYFDFSGYSDMAVGIARMFGIKLPENFHSPYKARNIIDFWRRWHITLSRFLRDYIYIPLGGSRRGPAARYLNILVTMLIGGLWHGAGWTFVLWGGIHGLLLAVNHAWNFLTGQSDAIPPGGGVKKWAGIGITFISVVVAWVVFRAESIEGAVLMISTMFGINGIALPSQLSMLPFSGTLEILGVTWGRTFSGVIPYQEATMWVLALCCGVLLLPNTQQIMRRYSPVLRTFRGHHSWKGPGSMKSRLEWRPIPSHGIIIACIFTFSLILILGWHTEFLYFQF